MKITKRCSNCGKDIVRVKSEFRNKNQYCCIECEKEFKHNLYYEIRKCEICDNEYECRKSSTQRFCNIECQGKWQSTQLRELNPRFRSKKIKCEWCGNSHYKKMYKIENGQHCFCSNKCRQEWHKNIWSQVDENKNAQREVAINMLENGQFSHTETGCQIIVNSMLDDLSVEFINEKNIDNYYTVDNYLTEYNLIIEVMGTYWHTDPRKYKEINYKTQLNRISKDKAKHTHIKNKYNIDILYLWENDILNNSKMCEKLIIDYINNKGILDNYHSFNYEKENKSLKPYQEWDIKDIYSITNLKLKELISKKQQDKWKIYNCEYCGKECEELISHYNTKKTHCCSRECSHKLQSVDSIEVKCENCNQIFNVKPYVYKLNKSKQFCCSKNCRTEYLKKRKRVVFNCDYCGKENSKILSNYNKSKNNHFCDLTCMQNYKESKKSIKIPKPLGKPVEIFKDGVSLGIFPNCAELGRQSEELFGIKLSSSKISLVCTGKKLQYKSFTFKYVEDSNNQQST